MLGLKERDQLELLITGSLRQLIPDDHVLVRVDRVLDLSWLRDEVADLYCLDDGRPGIDPEVAVRLMLAGLLSGIVHDRKLMREAHVNIAIRWFIGYGVHERLPDHSSLTRIRQRWGAIASAQSLSARLRRVCKPRSQPARSSTLTLPSSEPMSVGRALSSVTWSRCSTRTTSRAKSKIGKAASPRKSA